MTCDILGIAANCVTAFGTFAIPFVLLFINFQHKKKRKKEKVIEVCAYEFLTSFIIPFYKLYDYFFPYADENVNGFLIIAMENLKEKRVSDVRNEMMDNELDWEFLFFEKHVADLGMVFSDKLGVIYNFTGRARMLGRMQQAIIEEMNQSVILANEMPVSSEGKNKKKKAKKSNKANGYETMVDMKDYLENVTDQNVLLVLAQIKALKDVIEMLPDEMEIENKRQRMKK